MLGFTLLLVGALLIYAVLTGKGPAVWQAFTGQAGAGAQPTDPTVQTPVYGAH